MQITYTIASEQGAIAVSRKDMHEDGRIVERKQVAMRDGSFVGFTRNEKKTEWRKDSWGKMAEMRFFMAKEAAKKYLQE